MSFLSYWNMTGIEYNPTRMWCMNLCTNVPNNVMMINNDCITNSNSGTLSGNFWDSLLSAIFSCRGQVFPQNFRTFKLAIGPPGCCIVSLLHVQHVHVRVLLAKGICIITPCHSEIVPTLQYSRIGPQDAFVRICKLFHVEVGMWSAGGEIISVDFLASCVMCQTREFRGRMIHSLLFSSPRTYELFRFAFPAQCWLIFHHRNFGLKSMLRSPRCSLLKSTRILNYVLPL